MACEICKKPYVPPTDDNSFDSNEKPHVCNICCKSFSLKIQLKRHILSHEQDVPYICNTCEKHLEQSSDNLRLSKKGTFTCEICNKNFSSKRLLLRHSHASEHIAENVFNCDECGKGFKNVTALKKHATVHKAKKNSPGGDNKKEEPAVSYLCNTCGKKFIKLGQFEKHQLTHKYQCKACGENFSSINVLEEHQASGTCESKDNILSCSTNMNVDNSNSDSKKHACNICNQSFARKSALEGHVATHFIDGQESPVEDDSVVNADFQYKNKSDKSSESPKRQCLPKLKIRRSFPCEKCDVICASKKTYDRHVMSHETIPTEVKSYICYVCNETFFTKENYKKHKLSHENKNGEQGPAEKKTYTCQLCYDVFCKKRHLRKHLKCHFDLDPNDTSSISSEDIEMSKRPKRTKIGKRTITV